MKLILIYNMNDSKREQIKEFCSRLHLAVKDVAVTDYLKSIGSLVNHASGSTLPFTGIPFREEMMVFHDFKPKEIESFLDKYNASGLEKVNLKAQTTPHNIAWNSLQLHDELSQEHRQFSK